MGFYRNLRGFFQFSTVRHKLIFVIFVTLFVAMMISSTLFVIYDRLEFRQNLKNTLGSVAQLTVARSTAAMAFSDKQTVIQNLSALLRSSTINFSCIYNSDNRLYAERYHASYAGPTCAVQWSDQAALHRSEKNAVFIVTPIKKRDDVLGKLLISGDLSGLNWRSVKITLVTVLVAMLAVVVAYIITFRLQQKLVEPIELLIATLDDVSNSQDFSLRAKRYSHDEIGRLVDSFNSLLNRIESAHSQLYEVVAELEEQSLRLKYHAKQSENRKNEAQSILASASHDLKQPLQAMAMFIEVLKDTPKESQSMLFYKLDQAVENMRQLFTDLLDVSSLETIVGKHGQGSYVSLTDMLKQVSSEFSLLADNKNLDFRTHFEEISLRTHPSTMQRIVRNLLSNALRYTESGGILLSCRKRRGHIAIEVWDTGPGIPADKQSEIFKQFVQIGSHKGQSSLGVGLGLSIVKRSCELLDYKVSLFSREQRGSVFRVSIPDTLGQTRLGGELAVQQARKNTATGSYAGKEASLLPEEASGSPSESRVYPSTAVFVDEIEGKRVYLIDDDATIRESISSLLRTWGVNVIEAESLATLHNIIASENNIPDLVISDYQLGENQLGDDAIAALRSHFGHIIPAIIITGIGDRNAIQALKEEGFKVLEKPVKPAKLRSLMMNMLS